MASPESNRIGGARPSGAGGVKNLLAMFEKSSSSSSPSSGNGSNSANPAFRDQSPAPRPLPAVRTSFVAVTGNGSPMLGLQKVPVPSSPMSPVVSSVESVKLAGETLDKEKDVLEKEMKKEVIPEAIGGKHLLDEANLKRHDLESQNGYTTPTKASVTPPLTGLSPSSEKVAVKQEENAPEKPLDSIPVKTPEVEPVKLIEVESKPKSAATKAGPAPKSPTKTAFSSNKLAPTTRSGKNLTLPSSKSTTTSPLPSPALPLKSPVRSVASTSSSGSRAKPPTAAQGTGSSSARSRTAASTTTTSTSTTSKPRQPTTATDKGKISATKKVETKPAREPSKPPTIRSSAFAPTAASAAKLAADQKTAAARSRPPSSVSVRNRSPPSSTGMRRGNSGTNSGLGRKDQRSPQRPQTSAAIRNPNRTSVGSVAGVPGATGGDFLSRMMRPTTASAGKVSDKKPGAMNPPSKRSASVASTSRRRETSLPPPTGRLQKQKTGEKPKVGDMGTEVPQQLSEAPSEVQDQVQEAVSSNDTSIKGVTNVETPTGAEVEVEVETQESEDGGQSPTTTTSSTTLVHEGEGKDDEEILVKE